MKWGEFSSLLSGINGDTSLGNIVRIRSEKNPDIIKNFNESEKKIRSEYLQKNVKETKNISREEYDKAMENFKNMFKSMANQEK